MKVFFRQSIAALMATTLLASCNVGSRDNSAMTEQMSLVEATADSMYYGICLDVLSGDSISFLSDDGDSVMLVLGRSVRRIGILSPSSRIAVIKSSKFSNEVSLFVNLSMLMGQWVQPDPMSGGNTCGFLLAEGGAAQTLNIADYTYDNWRVFNGKLLIDLSYTEGMGSSTTDTFNIVRLTADSLWLQGAEHMYLHRMLANERLDETQELGIETPSDESYDYLNDDAETDDGEADDMQFFNPDFDVAPR